jgi:peptidyl-prolyl cis-trans isomerase C
MIKRPRALISQALLLSAIALLPGCNWWPFGAGHGKGCCPAHDHQAAEGQAKEEEIKIEGFDPALLQETVVSFEGKPVVTGRDFEKNLQMIMEAQPAIKDMLPYIPAEQQEHIFGQMLESMALEKLMLRWVKDAGIEESAEYRRNACRVHEAVDRDLALRAFENELVKEVVITDQEAEKFYQDNKTTEAAFQRPPFLITAGGVKAKGIEAKDEKEAKELAEKIKQSEKEKGGGIASVAKETKKSVVDYGLVNPQSLIDSNIKSHILATMDKPIVEVVRGEDDKYYVIATQCRQEPKYSDFDQVKDAVKQVLTNKRVNELYAKRIAELKDKYKMEINKSYIQKRPKPAAEPVSEEHPEAAVQPSEQPLPEKPATSKGTEPVVPQAAAKQQVA